MPSTKKSYATGECNNLRKYNLILIDIYLYNKQIPYHHPLCHFKKICALVSSDICSGLPNKYVLNGYFKVMIKISLHYFYEVKQ